jgi:hypothetical protein
MACAARGVATTIYTMLFLQVVPLAVHAMSSIRLPVLRPRRDNLSDKHLSLRDWFLVIHLMTRVDTAVGIQRLMRFGSGHTARIAAAFER